MVKAEDLSIGQKVKLGNEIVTIIEVQPRYSSTSGIEYSSWDRGCSIIHENGEKGWGYIHKMGLFGELQEGNVVKVVNADTTNWKKGFTGKITKINQNSGLITVVNDISFPREQFFVAEELTKIIEDDPYYLRCD